MPGQLTEKEKAARSEVLFALEAEQSHRFRSHYIGKTAEVLWEDKREIQGGLYWIGHTRDYVKVAVPAGEENLSNRLSWAAIDSFLTEEILLGANCD
jgi:threonylcarbamoyladenosine tRNA methylthiotransferase MtaB